MTRPVVFWQPILSIHQTPLLEEFGRIYPGPVYLVVDKLIPETRADAGWNVRPPSSVQLISPDEDVAGVPSRAMHVVSGYVGPRRWVQERKRVLSDDQADVIVMVEGFSRLGGPLKRAARFVKQWRGRMHLRHHLRGVLAIGQRARRQAKRMGMPVERIYPMLYATALPRTKQQQQIPQGAAVFVGRRSERKNTAELIRATAGLCPLVLIGPKEKGYDDGADTREHVHVLGPIANESLADFLREAAVLVLPSWYDGWGAVVNEALACGTPVVCSRYAGAADLITSFGPFRGVVVDRPDEEQLREAIAQVLHAKQERAVIRAWAEQSISPAAVAPYLQECLLAAAGNHAARPTAPWHAGVVR
ncbi:glycosyltransferase family 4 protein [Corynebacterium gerontici]|uniref:Teichuronic acid biosynthesis glycosyltransferase TuaC n=1 Tax=Corynebacterium gerontici TaxID=2079234 RepID=A0A3G6IXS2_9CORY|nr:glycosyltransferase family 4 protein [Corynebacterium gerontici]AZA10436.1 Putative teichuronic acid biosynthesis glycosyltransferase TuaC [Corynebacterium gerontici]